VAAAHAAKPLPTHPHSPRRLPPRHFPVPAPRD
jgi:hypothetical protein